MSDGANIDSSQRVVTIGSHVVQGRASGNYVTIVQPDRTTMDIGVDGEGATKTTGNRSATVTIALTTTSNSNDVLSAIESAGLPVPVSIKESEASTARSVFVAARMKVTKKADLTWSDGTEVRAWTLITTRANNYVGGMAASPINDDV